MKIPRSALRFLVSGTTTVAIDGMVYAALLWLGLDYDTAKVSGFISGMIFAFVVSRMWTFSGHTNHYREQIPRFVALYLGSLAINATVNHFAIEFGNFYLESQLLCVVAWLAATVCSACANYLGMRFVVFPHDRNSAR